jgi:hypothetical protein
MVSCSHKLVLFGGYGYPPGPFQSGAEFIKDYRFADGIGWTNELHVYDLEEGELSMARPLWPARVALVYVHVCTQYMALAAALACPTPPTGRGEGLCMVKNPIAPSLGLLLVTISPTGHVSIELKHAFKFPGA